MKRILFVDDEQRILDGLQRMLRPMRREWEMVFALGSQEGLRLLESSPFDVVVSDMRMPGMDGATFLARVQEKWPRTIRIVLSGHAELEASIRAVPVAHQFLSKPCDADTIKEAIRRIFSLYRVLESDSLRGTVGQVDSLPAQPKVYTRLLGVLANADYSVSDLTRILEQDPGLTAKILQTVNSAFFGRARQVSSLKQAVSILGSNLIKNMTLSSEVFRTFGKSPSIPGFSLEDVQRHSMLTAGIAHRILKGDPRADDAFTAAILHDVGKLILACHFPEWLTQVVEKSQREGRPLHLVEVEFKGVSHAEVGAYLLGLWGLPALIVEAVTHHHHPGRVGSHAFDLLTAVHVANALAHEAVRPQPADPATPPLGIDPEYLESTGAAERLPAWRALARDLVGARLEECPDGN